MDRIAVNGNLTIKFFMISGKDFHQGAFSGSVFSNQTVHFTWTEVKINIVKGQGSPKTFTNPFQFKQFLFCHNNLNFLKKYSELD